MVAGGGRIASLAGFRRALPGHWAHLARALDASGKAVEPERIEDVLAARADEIWVSGAQLLEADEGSIDALARSGSEIVGFIHGSDPEQWLRQIATARRVGCRTLVSEALPDELPDAMPSADRDFFARTFQFLAPGERAARALSEAADAAALFGAPTENEEAVARAFFESLQLPALPAPSLAALEGKRFRAIASFSSHPAINHALSRHARDVALFADDHHSALRYWMDDAPEPVALGQRRLRDRYRALAARMSEPREARVPDRADWEIETLYRRAAAENAPRDAWIALWIEACGNAPPRVRDRARQRVLDALLSGAPAPESPRWLLELIKRDDQLPAAFVAYFKERQNIAGFARRVERAIVQADQRLYDPAPSFVHAIERFRGMAASPRERMLALFEALEPECDETYSTLRLVGFKHALYLQPSDAKLLAMTMPSLARFQDLETISMCAWALMARRVAPARLIFDARARRIAQPEDEANPLWALCVFALGDDDMKEALGKSLSARTARQKGRSPLHILQALLHLAKALRSSAALDAALEAYKRLGAARAALMEEALEAVPPTPLEPRINAIASDWVLREVAALRQ